MASSPSRTRMASNQHRVLLYTTCYNVLDGVTLTIRKLEQEILAAGHHVCILTTVSGDPANTHLEGTHPNRRVLFMDNGIPVPFLHDPNNPEITYQVGHALSQTVKTEIEEFEPSIIHITAPDCTALHLIQYARQRELPIMGTYHSNIPEYMDHYPGVSWLKHILGAFFRHQYNFLQALYVPTPYIQKHLMDTYKMDSVTSLGIWGRGVDTDKFHPEHRSLKYRRSIGIPDDTVVICWVGRLVPEKRPDIFASVVRRLHAERIDFHTLVIGAGQCEEECKALPNTTFCGWLNTDQLSVAYASCDVFLFPSGVETFGNVTLEAASSGLPVVVEAGCSGHLVQNNGFACPEGDEDAFYQATRELVVNDKMRQSCSLASRNMALSLEKRKVVCGMLDNYSHVTDQFYKEYGGHHANRDQVYRKPDSFVGGNHPRPLLLVMVEYLFLMLFQVMWNMTSIFVYMRESLLSLSMSQTGGFASEVTIAPTASNSVSTATSPSSAASRRNSPERMARSSGDAPPIVELTDIEISSELQLQGISNSASLSDDEADAESSGSNHEEASSTCCASSSFGDCQLSHTLAKGFVSTLEFQCRMESHLRNACTACCKPALRAAVTKRKNSGFGDDEQPLRTRSSPETVELVGGLNAEGHRLRRQLPLAPVDTV